MKEKMITRTIQSTKVDLISLTRKDGVITEKALYPLDLPGKVTSDSIMIQKAIKEVYPDEKTVLVDSVETTEKVYAISLTDFIKYGKEITSENPENV